uniref:Delta-like protein n=1 Tax=Strongyloides venezuelensis TaxID=75913 RepID=A0A0K0G2R9_STRVS
MFSIVLLYLLICLSIVSPNGVFEVKFTPLVLDEGKLFNITVCLKEYQTIVNDDNTCRYGSSNFQILPSINRTSIISLTFTQIWPGSHSLIIKFNHDETFKISRLRSGKTSWLHVTSNKYFNVHYRIRCSQNYYGNECSRFCNPPIHENEHFTCTDEGYIECLPGWSGKKCDRPICLKGCGGNGKCIGPDKCLCPNSQIQETCQECITLPGCQNGYCSKNNECTCEEGWGGKLCNIKLSPCQIKNICRNGGICKLEKDGTSSCECQKGYFGKYCQKKRKTCNEHTCLNDGTCYINNDGIPKCHCINNFIGTYCQIKLIRSQKMNIKSRGGHLEFINYTDINMILVIIASLLSVVIIILILLLLFRIRHRSIHDGKNYKNEHIHTPKFENEYTLEPQIQFNEMLDFSIHTPQLETAVKKKSSRNSSTTCLKPFNNIYYTISYE